MGKLAGRQDIIKGIIGFYPYPTTKRTQKNHCHLKSYNWMTVAS